MHKRRYQLHIYTFISCVILSLLLTYFLYRTFTILVLVNTFFMTGLFCFLIGIVLFLIQGGSFNGITYSFKRFFKRTTRTGEMLREVTPEEEEESYLPKERYFSLTYPLLLTGGILSIVSLITAFNI